MDLIFHGQSQDLQTLEKSPFVVFVDLFKNSFNKNSVNRKDYNDAIMKKWESCPFEIRELCLAKSLKISERNAGWQKDILNKIVILKKSILAQAVLLPPTTSIENHNFRYHHTVKENISERVTNEKLLETCARPEVYFDVAIVEPFQHEVDKVMVTENVTPVESLFQQPQPSCFDDDDWEPVYIDESPCQQESIIVAPGHLEAIGDVSAVEYQEYVFHIDMRIRNRIARFNDYDSFLLHLFQFCGVLYQKQDICGINGTLIGPSYQPENFKMSMLQDSVNVSKVTVLMKSSRNTSLSSSTPQLTSKVNPIGSVSSNANDEALQSTSKSQMPIPAPSHSNNATNACAAKKTTSAPHSLLRFFHVKPEVTFDHIVEFCSQCGEVVFVKEIETEKWIVEIAVDRTTAAAFVAKQGKTCRINNSRCVVATSFGSVIFGKTDEWQNKIDAYNRKKLTGC
ncbi:hypothetical protein DAPPUDRAFT_328412 [Daphnia pulex]|uniref:Uncharacterized protein n=1 Tax=Daphnia pulex TaxID=6669 RepID=E9HDL6_DAPPU|nr:hypothetical protein DAPPUDRAFT_328412 [Daphnia pulex]|eukprot:EFX70192.1 hypothetical protein DAPPUDRAFT_328412 [Daphnia pulex]